MKEEAKAQLDDWIQTKFESLYRDLSSAFPHPFEWMHLLHRPRWWQRHRLAAHREICLVFANHGILLTDDKADHFLQVKRNHPQSYDEDCGGSIVRQLRATFGYAFIGPFVGLLEESN